MAEKKSIFVNGGESGRDECQPVCVLIEMCSPWACAGARHAASFATSWV